MSITLDNTTSEPNLKVHSTTTHFYLSETADERNERIKELFDILDKEKKGYLDSHAIQTGFTAMTHLPSHATYANELLSQCDTLHKDSIDFKAFKAYVDAKENELWDLFQALDSRGQGHLQPKDLQHALKQAGLDIDQNGLDAFLNLMDLDGNGLIDFMEFKNFLLLLPQTNIIEMYKYYESSTQLNHDGEVIIPPTDETSRHASRYLLAGGIAGAVSRTCTAPFDRLKIHLITHKGTPQKPLTILSAAQSIYGYGGWKSFFVGNGLNVLKIMPESAIKFYAYESFKRLFADLLHCQDKDDIPTAARFAAGGLAGICSQFTIYPLETVKTRMMVQVTTTNTLNLHKASYSTMAAIKPQNRPTVSSKNQSFFPYSLVLDTVKSTYARGGVKAFWPGLTIGLIGVFPYQAMDLGIYETLKIAYLKYSNKERNADGSQKKPNLFILLGCGAISGTIGASSVYPLSVIRTKLQAQGTKGHPMIYKSAWDAIHVTLLDSGVRGLYRGLGPSLLKVVPAISLTYVTYEWSKEKLGIS